MNKRGGDNVGIGINLKNILSIRKISIKQLSEMTGIPINTLYSITKNDNKNVRSDTLQKIAAALDIKNLELIDFAEQYGIPNTDSEKYMLGTVEESSSIEILENMKKLNDLGKQEAAKRIEELTHIEKYIK